MTPMRHRFVLDGEMTRDQIPDVRKFVERMHRKVLGHDSDLLSRVAMATHELFENAVKFSLDGSATLTLSIDVSREDEPLRVCITTTNRASDEDVQDLRELAKSLAAADNMMAFYVDMMRNSDPTVRGGLGLGRVAAEAEMTLKLDLSNDQVVISAELVEAA